MAPRSVTLLAAAALSAAMFAGADAQAFVPVENTHRKMLASRMGTMPKMAVVGSPMPAPAPAPAMGAEEAEEAGPSRRLQAAKTKASAAAGGVAAAPAGAVAGKLPLMADARAGAPAAGMDVAEATLPSDAMKPSKQMRVAAKAAMPIKRVGALIRGAGGAGPAPAPAPAAGADAVEASGM